jgi:hypothetical protein
MDCAQEACPSQHRNLGRGYGNADVDEQRNSNQSRDKTYDYECATDDFNDPTKGAKNCGAGMPILMKRPTPRAAEKRNF